MNDDAQLLLRYARDHSEAAFAELVRRHVDLVYSAALRRCSGDTHRAEEVVQQVFTSLARNAEKLAKHPALGAWLYAATRNAVINLAVAEQRRVQREKEAVMSGFLSAENDASDWSELGPVLDEVMDGLSETDRTAVLMRFFKKHSFAEIGGALNVSENTARMRTERALEKLRVLLQKRGVRSASSALGLMLGRQAVVAAPAGFAAAVTVAILGISQSSVVAAGKLAGRGMVKTFLTVGVWVVVIVLVTVVIYSARKSLSQPATGTASEAAEVPKSLVKVAQPKPPEQSQAAAISAGQSLAPSDPKAEEILKKMAAAYAALLSYQDSGEVVEKTLEGVERGRIAFQTNFRRPDQFCFNWSKRITARLKRSGRVWWFGEEGGSHSDYNSSRRSVLKPGLVLVDGIRYAQGGGFHVPRFFAGKDGMYLFSLADLTAASMPGQVMFEDVSCYVIKGQHLDGTPFELWISQKDFLLRKIVTVAPLVVFKSQKTRRAPQLVLEEIHREIRMNGTVSDEIFREARLLASQAEK